MIITNRNQEIEEIINNSHKIKKLQSEQKKRERKMRMIKIDHKTVILTNKKGHKEKIKNNFVDILETNRKNGRRFV